MTNTDPPGWVPLPDNLNTDFENLTKDLAARDKAIAAEQAEKTSLLNTVLPKLNAIKDPFLAMAYVMYVFQSQNGLQNDGTGGSIIGELDSGIGVLGANLSISGDFSSIQADYQSFLNTSMQKPYDPTGKNPAEGPDTNDVRVFAETLDKMIGALKNPGNAQGTGIDSSETSSLLDNLCEIRRQMHVSWDSGTVTDSMVDPTSSTGATFEEETNAASNGGKGVSMDTDDPNKIQGFNQLNYDAQQQGDTHGAAAVLQIFNNDDNSAKTALSSISQVVSTNLSHATNLEKEVLGLYNNLIQSFYKAMSAAVTNYKTG